ncbi:MAG: hypothetical protein HYT39_01570 [Candidatus Sungbacteria bacterium]|nr:hypothetical protein [Candidatus Sungbacteria bacterium]
MIGKARADLTGIAGGQVIALFLLLLLFLLDFWASGLPTGTLFPQWDKAVHTLGGALVAGLFYPYFPRTKVLLFSVFLIGAVFEVIEFLVSATPAEYGGPLWYALDTALDIIVDVAGAWIMLWLIRRFGHE